MYLGLGGNPYGPAGTGKTESVKALGGLFGRQVLVFNCDEVSSPCTLCVHGKVGWVLGGGGGGYWYYWYYWYGSCYEKYSTISYPKSSRALMSSPWGESSSGWSSVVRGGASMSSTDWRRPSCLPSPCRSRPYRLLSGAGLLTASSLESRWEYAGAVCWGGVGG